MTEPRKPTSQEKSQLAFYVAENYLGGFEANDHLEQATGQVENAAIAVFDKYITDSPGYAGKLMTVVWGAGPAAYEVYIWRDGEIDRISQDPEFSK